MTSVYGCTNYCVKSGEIPAIDGDKPAVFAAVLVHSQSIAEAVASSSRYAKIRASERALEAIGGMLVTEFRLKYHCDCAALELENVKELDIGTAV